MSCAIPLLSVVVLVGPSVDPSTDPTGDVYSPGFPGTPALGTIPDLTSGTAFFDAGNEELRFDFAFTDNVYPADDYVHFDNQLHGYIDIDIDVPPTGSGNSWKSELSGYNSNLGIEAYINLATASSGQVTLSDAAGGLLANVPIAFDGSQVSITIPFADLYGSTPPGNAVAYAAYFYDLWQSTADVFPNNDGYLISVPEPVSLSALGIGGWVLLRRRWA